MLTTYIRSRFLSIIILLLLLSVGVLSGHRVSALSASSTDPCVSAAAPVQWKHVVVLMFENKTYGSVIGSTSAPYISNLANKCGTYTSWNDANSKVNGTADGSYDSKPNYATLTSGVPPSVHGLINDNYAPISTVDNIYNQVRTAGKNARDYYSGTASTAPCATSNFNGDYHDAIRYYSNLGGKSTDPTTYCNTHDVPLSSFMTDVNAGNLPEFSMILPSNSENMHDNTVNSGDTWAKNFLSPLLDSAQYKSGDTAVFFLWDEDKPIPNVLLAPSIVPGSKIPVPVGNPVSHFSAIRTWQEMLGLPYIGDTSQAPSLLSFFNGGGTPPQPVDNAPAVSITDPASGAVLTTSPVTISATATDDTGVTKVEFYDGTTLLGTDTAAPYSYSWNTSTLSGSHSLTAKAYDAAGHSTVSAPVSVTVSIPAGCTNNPVNPEASAVSVVSTPAPGTYHVWSRIMTPDTTNNSYYLQIDGGCPVVVGDNASLPASTWTWVDYQNGDTASHIMSEQLAAGSHTITMTSREKALRIDRVMLLTDTCVPAGMGGNCADATAPTVSVTSPTANQNLTGTVNLSATASDNDGGSGVAGVEFLVDGNLVGQSVPAPYQLAWNSTTVPDGSHTISARATDIAGNTAVSSSVAVTVSNADRQAPSEPTGLAITANTYNKVDLSWNASTDNVAITSYKVLRGGIVVGTVAPPAALAFSDTTVVPNTAYSYSVVALDAAGNQSAPSSTVTVTTPQQTDTQPPTAPAGLTATVQSATSVSLSWTASTDDSAVTTYYVQRGGVVIGTTATLSYTDTTASPQTQYTYAVMAGDAAGNVSPLSNTATVTTPAVPDTTPPTAPASLYGSAVNGQVELNWTASTDDVGVAAYNIYRGGVKIATSTTTTFGDAAVSAGQTYTYYVTASDKAGNTSPGSNQVSVAVPATVSQTSLTLGLSDDAEIRQNTPGSKYGTTVTASVDGSPTQDIMMKATVTGVNGRIIKSAKLQLWCTNGSSSGGTFYPVSNNTWSQSTVTWSNAPAAATTALASLPTVASGKYYTVDLTNYIRADGSYSLRLKSKSSDGADYSTRENTNSAQRPKLILTVQ